MVFSRARRNGCVNVEALFRRASAPTWRGIRSYNVCCTGSDLTLRVCSVRERPNAVARTRPYCVPGLQMQVSGVRGKLTSNALFYFRQSGGRGGDGETCQVLSKPRNQKHFCLKGERKASELPKPCTSYLLVTTGRSLPSLTRTYPDRPPSSGELQKDLFVALRFQQGRHFSVGCRRRRRGRWNQYSL